MQNIGPERTIQGAAKLMLDGNFGMMPVAENDRMIGSISDRDIVIRAIARGKGPHTLVRDVMSPGIQWAREDGSITEAARLMSEHRIRRLPIVTADKRLVGIISLGDLAVEKEDVAVAGAALSMISRPTATAPNSVTQVVHA